MTWVAYEALRRKRPEMELRSWRFLNRTDRKRVHRLTVRELVARRLACVLRDDPGDYKWRFW